MQSSNPSAVIIGRVFHSVYPSQFRDTQGSKRAQKPKSAWLSLCAATFSNTDINEQTLASAVIAIDASNTLPSFLGFPGFYVISGAPLASRILLGFHRVSANLVSTHGPRLLSLLGLSQRSRAFQQVV